MTTKTTKNLAGTPARFLQDVDVNYKYIPKSVFGVTDKKHPLYEGKLDGSIDTFSVLRDTTGKFIIDIPMAHLVKLEKEMALDPGSLNVNNRKNEYLFELSIEVPKYGLQLNLSDPFSYLTDGILKAYNNVFAPNLKEKTSKASYRYVRTEGDEEVDMILEISDYRKTAYKLLGTLEDSRERMIMTLLNDGRRLSPGISDKDLRKLVNDLAEEDYSKFIRTLEDPQFTIKGILNMAVIVGSVEVNRGLYFYETEPLAAKGESSTLFNACVYLEDPTNGSIKMAISKATLDGFNRTKE